MPVLLSILLVMVSSFGASQAHAQSNVEVYRFENGFSAIVEMWEGQSPENADAFSYFSNPAIAYDPRASEQFSALGVDIVDWRRAEALGTDIWNTRCPICPTCLSCPNPFANPPISDGLAIQLDLPNEGLTQYFSDNIPQDFLDTLGISDALDPSMLDLNAAEGCKRICDFQFGCDPFPICYIKSHYRLECGTGANTMMVNLFGPEQEYTSDFEMISIIPQGSNIFLQTETGGVSQTPLGFYDQINGSLSIRQE